MGELTPELAERMRARVEQVRRKLPRRPPRWEPTEVPSGWYSTAPGTGAPCGEVLVSRRVGDPGRTLYHVTRVAALGVVRPPAPLARVGPHVQVRFTVSPDLGCDHPCPEDRCDRAAQDRRRQRRSNPCLLSATGFLNSIG